jgi:hypothetical protein
LADGRKPSCQPEAPLTCQIWQAVRVPDRETEAARAVKMTFAADSGVMEHERQNDVGPQEQTG